MRPIAAHVSLDALRHNLVQVRRYAPQSQVMSVVKANAYGHGLLQAAQGLQASDAFAVLNISEAIQLRQAGVQQPILLLEGVFAPAQLAEVDAYQLDVVVHQPQQLQWLCAAQMRTPIRVFLKLDSGMHRLGFQPQDYAQAWAQLAACAPVREIVMMSHFANADQAAGITQAMQRIQQVQAQLPPIDLHDHQSLANSAAIVQHPDTHVGWVRPGIMLYGATPIATRTTASLGLQAVMTLQSAVIAVQTVAAGEQVGYGGLFTATRQTRVGVVACGYADGYPRHAPTGTPIAVHGQLTHTLGRVSMDMLAVDLTDFPEAGVGSPVECWGAQVPVDAVAQAAGTIGYELLCAVTSRVPFIYHA